MNRYEAQPEIPMHFTLVDLPQIKTRLVRPILWVSKPLARTPTGFLFEMSDKRLVGKQGELTLKQDHPDFNKFILSLKVIDNFHHFGELPSEWVARYFDNPDPDLSMVGEADVEDLLPKTGRLYETHDKLKKIYVEAASNDATDKVYIVKFSGPAAKWNEHEVKTSQILARIKFDPSF